ncbi:MAG: sirohydrochlorin cobaltochelatase [Oscillospiraceae bacterium]|nr:sirohydrochlorin cobaltochelatase [Oscillospiraceae bacterium]
MRKITAYLAAVAVCAAMMTACGSNSGANSTADTTEAATTVAEETTLEETTEETTESDETTEAETEAEAEDDEENYDTGDASLDNVRNQDEIGENELLVISFGTSFNDSRRLTIGAIEDALEEAFPDYSVRRGFTANIIIDHVQKRDGVLIDDVDAALQRAVDNGVKNLVVQPTHLMNGLEYNDLVDQVAGYADAFESVTFGEPLLTSDDDFKRVETAITDWTKDYDDGETAIVFMGHGTEAESNGVYQKMQDLLTADGFANYYIGTVEATPSLDDVLAAVEAGEYKRVILEPLMVVAGDHANNDMASDEEDSWKTAFTNAGYEVECVLRGLGENEEIRALYVEHAQAAIDKATESAE